MKQVSLILIGGGDRGSSYLKSLDTNPGRFKLVGIAEPVKEKREYLRDKYGVPAENCFESYEELLALPKLADVAMICTQDQMHFAPAMMAIEKKYNLLLEKPAAATLCCGKEAWSKSSRLPCSPLHSVLQGNQEACR